MQKINYQKKLDEILIELDKQNKIPSLLLHSCCAPCSSYVIYYLINYFEITVFYYNPNIFPCNEYYLRLTEQKSFIEKLNFKNPLYFVEGQYDQQRFYNHFIGLESQPEGGERCHICYKLRLIETAKFALKNHFDYFSTTLTVSPYKNSQIINHLGESLEKEYNVKFLYSDFKKREGYKQSIYLSKLYNLYRQNYCGCVFSQQ